MEEDVNDLQRSVKDLKNNVEKYISEKLSLVLS